MLKKWQQWKNIDKKGCIKKSLDFAFLEKALLDFSKKGLTCLMAAEVLWRSFDLIINLTGANGAHFVNLKNMNGGVD